MHWNRLAITRRRVLGEPAATARRAVGRRSLNLDECDTAQRHLRALLGLHLFNLGMASTLPGPSVIGRLSAYTMVMSPRFDELVVFADVPDTVTDYLVGHSEYSYDGVPGLRCVQIKGQHEYVLVHLPTAARVRVIDRSGRWDHDTSARQIPSRWLGLDNRLTAAELSGDAIAKQMSPDSALLISGIVSRFSARDPRERWSGSWWCDRLQRQRPTLYGDEQRQLHGHGDHWTLRWKGYPYPDDLALMLTDSICGVAGAWWEDKGEGLALRLGGAVLNLVHYSGAWRWLAGEQSLTEAEAAEGKRSRCLIS